MLMIFNFYNVLTNSTSFRNQLACFIRMFSILNTYTVSLLYIAALQMIKEANTINAYYILQ